MAGSDPPSRSGVTYLVAATVLTGRIMAPAPALPFGLVVIRDTE
jgi:hypothetical protein